YVAGFKEWTKEEHPIHHHPYVMLRDARTGKLLWHLRISTSGLHFSPDGSKLTIVESRPRSVSPVAARVVESASGKLLWRKSFGGSGGIAAVVHPTQLQTIATPGGSKVRSASPDDALNWTVSADDVVKAVKFSPAGRHLAYSSVGDEVVVLTRQGEEVARINCSGKGHFAWKSDTEIYFAGERGSIGLATSGGKILESASFADWLKQEARPLPAAKKIISIPSLYRTPFLDSVKALKPKVVSAGFTGLSEGESGQWPKTQLASETSLPVSLKQVSPHQRNFLVFRARSVGATSATLSLTASLKGELFLKHKFRIGEELSEQVIGLPQSKEAIKVTFTPGTKCEVQGPIAVCLPFEYPNFARMYGLQEKSLNPELQQYAESITLITEARSINKENLPAYGDYLKLLNGRYYDTSHWVREKFLTVHDYVVRRKSTSTIDYGSPIPVEIRLKQPVTANCVIAWHVPGAANSVTRDMAVEVWDKDNRAWKLVAFREDNRDLASVLAFDPIATDRVRYWMLATGNGRYGISEVQVFGPEEPGIGVGPESSVDDSSDQGETDDQLLKRD
ncbi:MAG: hypothetical protein QF473_05960, partial [Planctomycetota bacterium]|nr:hypothetical protein [Planctomycetota bacterium]